MLLHLMNQVALVIPRSAASDDVYGDQARTWDPDTGTEFICRLQPTKGREMEIDRDTRTTTFHVFLPAEAAGVITATSRVVIDGVTREVVGEPSVYSRRSQINHVEAILRTIEG